MNIPDYSALVNYRPPEERIASVMNASSAGEAVKRMEAVINAFMAKLAANEEVEVALASFGSQHVIVVSTIQAINPNLIVFYGWEQGRPATLIQHLSQLNFLLVPVESEAETPRRKIGFDVQ